MWSISCHTICMPLVIIALGVDTHACTHMHTDLEKGNFKKPGAYQPKAGTLVLKMHVRAYIRNYVYTFVVGKQKHIGEIALLCSQIRINP